MPMDRPLEVWAGVESTVNRVGEQFFDQLVWSGHHDRLSDLDLFAGLGIRALRYPALWERIAPERPDQYDWRWTDQRLNRLAELGIRPIVGLLHHGSGPAYTSLIDPDFPARFADFAYAVARRYPWIPAWTPVNEPLTTARFSGLYGIWYPHGKRDGLMVRALLQQVRGSQLAMQAVRSVNPQAEWVQTEDLGKTYSTPALRYQAEFDNRRRWLSLDLLTGRVDDQHPMLRFLVWAGATPAELEAIRREAVPPDVLGINHYITSERFLDENPAAYPAAFHGSNGQHAFADVEAVRVCAQGPTGFAGLLQEVWERYGQPVAITEAHMGGFSEERLRWFMQSWQVAHDLRKRGVDLRAVTAWALLGSFNWNVLLARNVGHYEPGVFDARGPQPRLTATARALGSLARTGRFDHPVLDEPGWWQRPPRLLYPPLCRETGLPKAPEPVSQPNLTHPPRRLLIIGANGTLSRAFQRICPVRGLLYDTAGSAALDIRDPAAVEAALDSYRPWAVINTAGYVRVDDAEREPVACQAINTRGAANLAQACARRGLPLVTFSSDLVFDGEQQHPYTERDEPAPLNVYGESKAQAEEQVLAIHPHALMVRTSAFFGPWDAYNFAHAAAVAARESRPFAAADDTVISPTYVPDLVHAALELLVDGAEGLWHLANPSALTWFDFARRVLDAVRLPAEKLQGAPMQAFALPARRPAYSVLGSERGSVLPPLEDSLERFGREWDGA
jgi:dTDP-4-dehydrorhamnose reductase